MSTAKVQEQIKKVEADTDLIEHNLESMDTLVRYWDGVSNINKTPIDKILRNLYATHSKLQSEQSFPDWLRGIAIPFDKTCTRLLQSNKGLDMKRHEAERWFGPDCPTNVVRAARWLMGLLGNATSGIKSYRLMRERVATETVVGALLPK